MRILLTSPTYPPLNSGLGNAVAQQAAALVRSGHEVIVATGGAQRASLFDELGVRIECFPVSGSNFLLDPIEGEKSVYINFLRNSSSDILIMNAWQNWATDLAIRHLDQISGRKFVYSHCISTNLFFSSQPFRSLIRYIAWRPYWWNLSKFMGQLDGLFFLASRGCDTRFDDLLLARSYKIPLHIISNSISQSALEIIDHQQESFKKRDRIIAVGSYQWQKGFDFVIQSYAISNMRNRIPLHLFGQEYFPYKDILVQLSRNLKIAPEFIFFHEGISGKNLITHYQKSLMVLSGSQTECQPLVLIDAAAAAVPFIARPTGCVVDMPGGITAKYPRQMAMIMNELEGNESLWQNLSDAAYAAAKNIYHPDIQTQKLLRALSISKCDFD